MTKQVFTGRQEEVAAHIEKLIWGVNTRKGTSCILDFLRIQRGISQRTGRSKVFTWRGIGIDVTPRACACWIKDPAVLRSWQDACRGVTQ